MSLDTNLTPKETEQLLDCFKKPEFRDLFADYIKEISGKIKFLSFLQKKKFFRIQIQKHKQKLKHIYDNLKKKIKFLEIQQHQKLKKIAN